MKKFISIILVMLLCLSACGEKAAELPAETEPPSKAETPAESTAPEDAQSQSGEAPAADFSLTDEDMFTDRDLNSSYDEASAVYVELLGSTARASSDSVKVSGSMVQLTEEATYIITGSLDDGMLVVNAGDTDKLHLVFSGTDISNATSAALYVLAADKVVITLAEGTENTLSNGGEFIAIDDSNIDAALFSKQDLTINGPGSLTVSSPASHGIVCKDDLVLTGGTLQVDAASHALDANDSIRVAGTSLVATAGKDGLHCENNDDTALGFVYVSGGSMKIDAQGDGISAGNYIQITGGSFDILAGGGSENGSKASSSGWGGFMGGGPGGMPGGRSGSSDSKSTDSTSMKGFKSGGDMLISGGILTINSADDAIHTNASLTISGGEYDIASGDDAIHAEDSLSVSGGVIRISECYEGLEAFHITVSGGDITLVATDDGLNAAGGVDSSGSTGGRDGMFPGGGGFGSGNSDGSIVISGGTIYINSSGDGIDANGTLEISGGHITITGPTQGDTATLDYDVSGVITGGTFIGTGSSMMAQTFSSSEQGVIAVSTGSQAAGTQITLTDKDGNIVISCAPELDFQVVILSCPDIVKGETYTITVGNLSGEFSAS